eukprot:Gb_02507 [translate_table: standard]
MQCDATMDKGFRNGNNSLSKVKIEDSAGFDTTAELNPQLCKMEVKNEDASGFLKCLQNPSPGSRAKCICDENELIPYLRDAVRRQDLDVVVQTLRGREARFKSSEDIMKNEIQTLRRKLDELRETEGKKLKDLQRSYDATLLREFECQNQCKELREKYEGFDFTLKQTRDELQNYKKQFEVLSLRERDAQDRLVGLKEICNEACNREQDAQKKVRELETKCEQMVTKEEMERMRDAFRLNFRILAGASIVLGKDSRESCNADDQNCMEEIVRTREGKDDTPILSTPCINGCIPKPSDNDIEALQGRVSRVKRALFRPEEEEVINSLQVPGPLISNGVSSTTTNLRASSCVPCTPEGISPECPDQLGKNQIAIGVGFQPRSTNYLTNLLLPEKGGGNLVGLSPSTPANNLVRVGMETCNKFCSCNPTANELVPDVVKIDEPRSDETEGNIRGHWHAKEFGDSMDIVKFDEKVPAVCLVEEVLENSPFVPNANIRSSVNKVSYSEVKTNVPGVVRLIGSNLIVLSDSESESNEATLRKKRKTLPSSHKTFGIQTTQVAEMEIQNRMNSTGPYPIGEHSDHSEEQLIQRRTKTRRGHQAAVISDSESNSSDVAFSCKRRKLQPSSSETQTIHATEGVELEKQGHINHAGGRNSCGSYHESCKENEVVDANHEPYACSKSDGDVEGEDLCANKESECVSGMKFRRLRRIREVDELHNAEQCKECVCLIEEGKHVPAVRFGRPQRVKRVNEFPSAEQFEEGMCCIGEVKCLPVANFRRLRRVGDAREPEQCKVGEMVTDAEEQSISHPDVSGLQNNNIIFLSDGGYSKASLDGRVPDFANDEKSAVNVKLAEALSKPTHANNDSEGQEQAQGTSSRKTVDRNKLDQDTVANPIDTLYCRPRRNPPRKAENLLKESDGEDEEDEGSSESEGEDLGGFIVDEGDDSESGSDPEGSTRVKDKSTFDTSDSEGSIQNLESDQESDPSSSEALLSQVLRKIGRQSKNKLDWEYEAEMLAAFAKDPVLCMRAICALYRQQTNEEKCGKISLYVNRRGFDKLHASRGSEFAEFLTENDPFGPVKKSVQEFEKRYTDGVQYCRNLAFHHSKQLFEIYRNNEDPHFPLR